MLIYTACTPLINGFLDILEGVQLIWVWGKYCIVCQTSFLMYQIQNWFLRGKGVLDYSILGWSILVLGLEVFKSTFELWCPSSFYNPSLEA